MSSWSLSSNVGKRYVAVHTAISQDSCKRDHESGILEKIRSQTCCSVTIDSKNHLVAPAVSTDDYPVIQEDAHRRLSKEEQQAFELATEKERETARTIVSRLHVELGHSDPRGMIDSLRRKHADRLIIATATKVQLQCLWRLHPVAARVLHEPGTCLQVDQFEWKHPVLNLHVLGTIMVDVGSCAASVTIRRVIDTELWLGNVTGEIMLNTLLNHWIKYYGKPNVVRTDPDGAFRDQGFRRGLAAKSMRLDIDPGDASWKTGVLGKSLDTIKQSAIRVARRTPDSVTIQEIFDESTTAHNDSHRNRGFSPWQLLLGKTPTDKTACEDPDLAQCSFEVVDEAAKQSLRVKEDSCKAYIEEELSLRKRRKEVHQSRPWRHWAASEWCWYWGSGKHKGEWKVVFFSWAGTCVDSRTRNDRWRRSYDRCCLDHRGTSLVRCAVQHLRSLSESEKRLCSTADTEAISFQDLVRRLLHSTFLDLTTQTDAPDDAWEEEITGWDPRSTRDPSNISSFWRINLTQHHVWDPIWCHHVDLWELMITRNDTCSFSHILRQVNRFHLTFLLLRVNRKIQHRQCPRVAFCSSVLQIRWTVWNLRNVPEVTMMIILHFFPLIIMIWRWCQKIWKMGRVSSVEQGCLTCWTVLGLPEKRNIDRSTVRRTSAERCRQFVGHSHFFAGRRDDTTTCSNPDPETAFNVMVKRRRAEVKVSTLSAKQKRELVEEKDKELNTFVKYFVVEAASRQGISPSALMKMRWVVTF